MAVYVTLTASAGAPGVVVWIASWCLRYLHWAQGGDVQVSRYCAAVVAVAVDPSTAAAVSAVVLQVGCPYATATASAIANVCGAGPA